MINLRDYQKDIIKNIYNNFDKKIHIIQAPTGAGKSVIMTKGLQYLLHNKNERALIVSPRIEINNQLEQYLIDLKINNKCKIITNLNRKVFNEITDYNYLIVDECHHFQAATYKKIWNATHNNCKLFGFTATPKSERLTKINNKICGLWGHFSNKKEDINYIQCSKQTKELIEDGNLSKFKMIPCYEIVKNVIEKAREIKSNIIREQSFTQIVGMIQYYHILDKLKYSKVAVGFCNTIEYCIELKKYLIEHGINTDVLVSETDKYKLEQDREKIVKDFKDGKIRVLLGVNIFNEGFDCPIVDTALMLRPTNSLIIYLQQVGRVLRPSPLKDTTYIFDFVGNGAYFGSPDSDWHWKDEFWLERNHKEKTLLDEMPIKECPVCLNVMSGNAIRECPYCHFDFYKWNTILGQEIYLKELGKLLEKTYNGIINKNVITLTNKIFIKKKINEKGIIYNLYVKNESFYWCFYKTNFFKHKEMLCQLKEICNFDIPLSEVYYQCKNVKIIFYKKNGFNIIDYISQV